MAIVMKVLFRNTEEYCQGTFNFYKPICIKTTKGGADLFLFHCDRFINHDLRYFLQPILGSGMHCDTQQGRGDKRASYRQHSECRVLMKQVGLNNQRRARLTKIALRCDCY